MLPVDGCQFEGLPPLVVLLMGITMVEVVREVEARVALLVGSGPWQSLVVVRGPRNLT